MRQEILDEARKIAREEIASAFKAMRFSLRKAVSDLGNGGYYETESQAAARHAKREALETVLEGIEAMTTHMGVVTKVTVILNVYNAKKAKWEAGNAKKINVRVFENEHAHFGAGGWDLYDDDAEEMLGQLYKEHLNSKADAFKIEIHQAGRYREIDMQPILDALREKGLLR